MNIRKNQRIEMTANRYILFLKAISAFIISLFHNLPARKIDIFGRLIGLKIFFKERRLDDLLLNPVSSVRYFEFDFVKRHIPGDPGYMVLDVSSPFLFGFYFVENSNVDYLYINPDISEFNRIDYLLQFLDEGANYHTAAEDAVNLPYEDESFNCVISISVIEHISSAGDSLAVSEMWRVLKPGGRLILTFPVMDVYEEEYRSDNVYSLTEVEQKDGSYFFQRFYDKTAVVERLLNHLLGHSIVASELYGEVEKGFFKDYEKRWVSDGLNETVKDPWLMATKMQRYENINDLAGLGVMGLALQKVV